MILCGYVRYIKGCMGDLKEARRRWDITLKWRQEFGTDGILDEAFPELDLIKECYPHCIHRRAKDGNLLYFERLGNIDIARLRENGVSMERLTRWVAGEVVMTIHNGGMSLCI